MIRMLGCMRISLFTAAQILVEIWVDFLRIQRYYTDSRRLPERRTVWGAFYDHIPSHSLLRKGWRQWKNKRRKVSFPEQKGPEIAKNGLKKLSFSIWEHDTVGS